ncbi:exonuclease domain-containing protein [Olsenella uli]|uniref:exonuclease domain-containing protein n=1 Tax=Olsenella uli TaxID=133926 RepID=UPI0024203660|nr:exonuclease domain-containing protein [Olsenella uli]
MADDLVTFLDVETPNRHNDSICSIAMVQTDARGNEVARAYTLVNPMAQFDDVNMRIHGITPRDVRDSPTFREVWAETISPLLDGSLAVAHNATYDLCVLWKAARAAGDPMGPVPFACTKAMAQRLMPTSASFRLPDVCRGLGVSMGAHHNATCDADGCMGAFWELARMARWDLSPFVSVYDGPRAGGRSAGHEGGHRGGRAASARTSETRDLIDMASRVVSDGVVSSDEAARLLSWIVGHEGLANDPVASRIMDDLQEALMDGDVSPLESDDLVAALRRLIDPAGDGREPVTFDGMRFCLTGSFEHGPKESVADHIRGLGGIVDRDVTKRCDYVVVGGCGSEAYSFGSYGGKVKKAMSWQERGVPIHVVRECDVYRD